MAKPPSKSRPTEATPASLYFAQIDEAENTTTAAGNQTTGVGTNSVSDGGGTWTPERRRQIRAELEQSMERLTAKMRHLQPRQREIKDANIDTAETASLSITPAENVESIADTIASTLAKDCPRIASRPIANLLGAARGAKQIKISALSPPRNTSHEPINSHGFHNLRTFGAVMAGSATSARVPAKEAIVLAASERTRTSENATVRREIESTFSEVERPTNGGSQQVCTDGTSMPVVKLTVENLNTHQSEYGATTRKAQPVSERAEKDSESGAASITVDVVAGSQQIQPTIETRTLQVCTADLNFASIPCDADTRLQKFHVVNRENFSIGDIGWFPILRPSVCPSFWDIQTQFGYVSGKAYPAVIIDTPKDSIFVLLITTAGGKGLKCKPESLQQRSARVVTERGPVASGDALPQVGKSLLPNTLLRVTENSRYQPEVE